MSTTLMTRSAPQEDRIRESEPSLQDSRGGCGKNRISVQHRPFREVYLDHVAAVVVVSFATAVALTAAASSPRPSPFLRRRRRDLFVAVSPFQF